MCKRLENVFYLIREVLFLVVTSKYVWKLLSYHSIFRPFIQRSFGKSHMSCAPSFFLDKFSQRHKIIFLCSMKLVTIPQKLFPNP